MVQIERTFEIGGVVVKTVNCDSEGDKVLWMSNWLKGYDFVARGIFRQVGCYGTSMWGHVDWFVV